MARCWVEEPRAEIPAPRTEQGTADRYAPISWRIADPTADPLRDIPVPDPVD